MTYEYECQFCGNRFEELRPMANRNNTADTACPHCHKVGAVTRVISAVAVHFIGAGWTRTPAIMRDPIAANSPMQGTNWGNTTEADLGRATGLSGTEGDE